MSVRLGVSVSTALTHPKVQVVHEGRGRVVKEKTYNVINGLASNVNFIVFNNNLQVALCALMERVYYHQVNGLFVVPALPLQSTVNKLLRSFKSKFSGHTYKTTPIEIMDFPNWYRGRKRSIYETAAKRLVMDGLSAKLSYLDTFVKVEKVMVEDKRLVPRLIQPRRPIYNVAVGRYIKHLEHSIYKIIGKIFNSRVVMKGKNVYQVAAELRLGYERLKNPKIIGCDASRFDQHVSVPLLKWEHQIYEMFYSGQSKTELKSILRYQLMNRGFINCDDGRVKYTKEGGRCSGDMNTASGNVLLMCAMMYAFLQSCEIPEECLAYFNNGDDCVLMVEEEYEQVVRNTLVKYFGEFGVVMKMGDSTSTFESIEFCQSRPVYDGITWRMVRNLNSLTKDSTILIDLNTETLYKYYLDAIGKCGLSLTSGLPILQEYYACMIRHGQVNSWKHPVLETGMMALSKGLEPIYRPVCNDARASFYNTFGIVPDVQIALEKYFLNLRLEYGRSPCIMMGLVVPYSR